jgi:hypothetical protein
VRVHDRPAKPATTVPPGDEVRARVGDTIRDPRHLRREPGHHAQLRRNGRPASTWYYSITPILGAGLGTESPRSSGVLATDTFTLSWPGTVTAGAGSTLTITAKAGSQTDTGYDGVTTLTFGGPGNAPNGTGEWAVQTMLASRWNR